jgi:hypothetical protein
MRRAATASPARLPATIPIRYRRIQSSPRDLSAVPVPLAACAPEYHRNQGRRASGLYRDRRRGLEPPAGPAQVDASVAFINGASVCHPRRVIVRIDRARPPWAGILVVALTRWIRPRAAPMRKPSRTSQPRSHKRAAEKYRGRHRQGVMPWNPSIPSAERITACRIVRRGCSAVSVSGAAASMPMNARMVGSMPSLCREANLSILGHPPRIAARLLLSPALTMSLSRARQDGELEIPKGMSTPC